MRPPTVEIFLVKSHFLLNSSALSSAWGKKYYNRVSHYHEELFFTWFKIKIKTICKAVKLVFV